MHLGGELFKLAAGVNLLNVPFRGAGPAMIDLVGGHTKVAFATTLTAPPYVRDGKLKALGIGAATRNAALPDVPTVAEAGVPGYEVANWIGIVAPAGTPQAIVEQTASGDFGDPGIAGGEADIHLPGRRDRAHEPGHVRHLHDDRDGQVGPRRQGGRHQGAVTVATIWTRLPRRAAAFLRRGVI